MRIIENEADILEGLDTLVRLDPRLDAIVARAAPVPLRRNPPGLRGLAGTITAQQVSIASARAIFGRFCDLVDVDDPAALAALPTEAYRTAGMSRGKERTLRAVAEACLSGALDFRRITEAPPAAAIAELVALPGIGVWTAECYLLFSLGHPDIFPAGDLALQVAVAEAFGLGERPKEKALKAAATAWSPHRSVAARLFWAYYAAITRRDAAPLAPDVTPPPTSLGDVAARPATPAAEAIPRKPLDAQT